MGHARGSRGEFTPVPLVVEEIKGILSSVPWILAGKAKGDQPRVPIRTAVTSADAPPPHAEELCTLDSLSPALTLAPPRSGGPKHYPSRGCSTPQHPASRSPRGRQGQREG